MASSSKSSKYMPLRLQSPELEGLLHDETKDHPSAITKNSPDRSTLKWNLLTTLAIILCTIFNFAIIFKLSIKGSVSQMPLKRPNQFIGLDKLNYNRSSLREDQLILTTFPTFVHQIDRAQPDAILPNSAQLEFTTFGTIAPETRLFLATDDISTIFQFRARDYAMEHCTLELSLPTMLEKMSIYQGNDKQRGWRLSGDTKDLEIWTLDTSEWLSASKLTYANRPKRLTRIGSLIAESGMRASTHGFPCPTDSIQSFELFCISPGCRVEVIQDRNKPVVGLVLKQHSSL